MSRTALCLLALPILSLALERPAGAIPAFARKYDTPCATCHAVYPKLTPFGRAFKENGFRMPRETVSWKETLTSIPASLRSTLFNDGLGPDTDRFTFALFKPIAAGSLGTWFSFWVDQVFFATDEDFDRGTDNAWVQVNDVLRSYRPDLLSIKAGKFELDLPFTQTRSYNPFPYEPYFLQTGREGWSFGAAERGFEVSGIPGRGVRYSLAVVEGVNTTPGHEDDFDADLYARLSKTFEGTERVGFFIYSGQNTLADTGAGGEFKNNLTRLGGDFDWRGLNGKANLYGLYLWGRNSNSIGRGVADPERSFNGGFVQLDGRAAGWFTLTGRYTVLRFDQAPSLSATRQSFAAGAQGWFRERLKVAFEYRFQDKGRSDWGALTFDFVF